MKTIRYKNGMPIIFACLFACFLLSACGEDTGMLTGSLPNSDIEVDMNSGHIYVPSAISDSDMGESQSNLQMIPNSELQLDMDANHIYEPNN